MIKLDDDNIPINTQNTGFTRYVEKQEFIKFIDKVETTFHGKDGRNGIVADIQILKTEWRTAKNLLNWVAGGSLLTFIVGVINLLKMFNVI